MMPICWGSLLKLGLKCNGVIISRKGGEDMYDNQYNLEPDNTYETFGFCPCKNNGCSSGCSANGAGCFRDCNTSCTLSCSAQCSWIKVVLIGT